MSLVAGAVALTAANVGYGAYQGGQQRKAYEQAWEAGRELMGEKRGLLKEDVRLARKAGGLQVMGAREEYRQAGQQYGLAGERQGLAVEGAATAYGSAMSGYESGLRGVGMGAQAGMRGVSGAASAGAARSGLARSGTVEQQARVQTGDIMAKYKSDTQKLFESKQFAGQQQDVAMGMAGLGRKAAGLEYEAAGKTLEGAEKQYDLLWETTELAYQKGEIGLQEAFSNMMSGMDQGGVGQGVMQGFMSSLPMLVSSKSGGGGEG